MINTNDTVIVSDPPSFHDMAFKKDSYKSGIWIYLRAFCRSMLCVLCVDLLMIIKEISIQSQHDMDCSRNWTCVSPQERKLFSHVPHELDWLRPLRNKACHDFLSFTRFLRGCGLSAVSNLLPLVSLTFPLQERPASSSKPSPFGGMGTFGMIDESDDKALRLLSLSFRNLE